MAPPAGILPKVAILLTENTSADLDGCLPYLTSPCPRVGSLRAHYPGIGVAK